MNPAQFLKFGLLICAGLLQTVAVCSPSDGATRGWLQVLCIACLVWVIDADDDQHRASNVHVYVRKSKLSGLKRTAAYSFVFTLSWLSSTFWWIYVSLHTYGGLPSGLAVAAVLILAAGLSAYYVLACILYVNLRVRLGAVMSAALFAATWTLAELARAQWFTGFPWGAVGYAHLDNPLKLSATYIGVYGTGFIACGFACILVSVLLAIINKRRGINTTQRLTRGNAVLAAIALVLLYPNESLIRDIEDLKDQGLSFTEPVNYALLQGNVPQETKFEREGLEALSWYKKQIMEVKAQWIITPETAIPVLKKDLPSGYLQDIAAHLSDEQRGGKALLMGMVGESENGYTNRVEGITTAGEVYSYDKHHLVPFGEFIPAWFKWFSDMLRIPLGSFKRGELSQQPWAERGQRVAVNICYEDVFGEELALPFVQSAGAEPTVMVNVSNIGWFGPFMAVEQHLNASRMRAVELQRPMLRATNTGATAAIDHNGYVIGLLPKGERGVLTGEVRGVSAAATPYARWSGRYSLYPLWALCTGLVLLALVLKLLKQERT